MSFLRPELAAALARWREPLVWGGALAGGLWLVAAGWAGPRPLALALGLVLVPLATGLLVVALRRVRFRSVDAAQGVVTVTEARIGYFGPFGGGFLDIDALVRVDLVTARAAAWSLTAEDGVGLLIPLGARGAEAIPDALSRLPGLDLAAARAALASRAPGRVAVWVRDEDATFARLH